MFVRRTKGRGARGDAMQSFNETIAKFENKNGIFKRCDFNVDKKVDKNNKLKF